MNSKIDKVGTWILAWTITVGLLIVASIGITATVRTNEAESARFSRACSIEAGSGWTEVDCSAAAAYSAELTENTRYLIQAVGGAPYFAVTTAGSGQDADSSDGYIPEGEWLEIFVPTTSLYLCCDGSGDSSTIRYLECQ